MKPTRLTVFGFFAGLILGLGDYFLLRAVDVVMMVDGRDVTLVVVVLFALNFAALGAVIARLWERKTELQKTQEKLVEAQTLAAVGRMAASVAHEVRNPLSVIKSSAQLIQDDHHEGSGDAARFIEEEVDRLDAFVGRVLDFSRPLEPKTERLEWPELQARLARVVGSDVKFDGDGDLYKIDPDLMVQLLANLVENARKSEANEVCVVGSKKVIEVVDDGHGVDESIRDSLFEPFFTTRAQGTGLGLAMAKKLARIQGWDLELAGTGKNNRGARFRLQFKDSPRHRRELPGAE